MKKKLNLSLIINCLIVFSLFLATQLLLVQKYIYETSIFHAYGYLIIGVMIIIISSVALTLKSLILKQIVKATNIVATILAFLFLLLQPFTIGASKTNDFANYKIFDNQVQSYTYDFFPDDIDNASVIKYDYFYTFSYHHVYSIYLEIKYEGNFIEYINTFRDSNIIEEKFNYDIDYISITFCDELEYYKNRIYDANIRKILYSEKRQTIIFYFFESWAYCNPTDIYYFERFNIDYKSYNSDSI